MIGADYREPDRNRELQVRDRVDIPRVYVDAASPDAVDNSIAELSRVQMNRVSASLLGTMQREVGDHVEAHPCFGAWEQECGAQAMAPPGESDQECRFV
jgi:hypothetical protein